MRPVELEDAAAVERVVNDASERDVELKVYSPGQLAREWMKELPEGFVVEQDERIAGFLSFEWEGETSIYFEAWIGPAVRTPDDLFRRMVAEAEDHARRAAAEAGLIKLETNVNRDEERAILEELDYETGMRDYAMFFELDDVPEAVWPAGMRVRPYREKLDDLLMHDVMKRGFETDWPESVEPGAWIQIHRDAAGYDPALWFFAEDGREVVGAIQCRDTWRGSEDTGWIKNVSVAREARGKGVGRALLHEAFNRFAQRGRTRVVLGVDAANPTRARDFYERLGMVCRGSSTDHAKIIGP